MRKTEKQQPPIRQSVRVDCPIDDTFRLFTEAFAEWWPLGQYSVTGEDAETCVIEPWIGGRVFERSRSGKEHDWGSVIAWDPPKRLSFAWDPSGATDSGSQIVDVEFEADADGTQVTLIHTGWEAPGVAVCTPGADYSNLWPVVLKDFFCEFVIEQIMAIA
jgi:uncharacterized protein YndB with AHSA1/START domain